MKMVLICISKDFGVAFGFGVGGSLFCIRNGPLDGDRGRRDRVRWVLEFAN